MIDGHVGFLYASLGIWGCKSDFVEHRPCQLPNRGFVSRSQISSAKIFERPDHSGQQIDTRRDATLRWYAVMTAVQVNRKSGMVYRS